MARPLTLDRLESKLVPAGGPVTPYGISLSAFGVLHIKGDGKDDVGTVTIENGQVHALHQYWVDGPVEGTPPMLITFQDKLYDLNNVKSISFFGASGNDEFTNDTKIKSVGLGGTGQDTLTGGMGADLLSGGNEADLLEGRLGNDELRGGAGNDRFVFKPSEHPLFGLGSDVIVEATNVDTDTLDFSALSAGISIRIASTATQTVKRGTHPLSITLSDSQGIENMIGTPGTDHLGGNGRANFFMAGDGNDTLVGFSGADRMYGQDGNDILDGGHDNDILDGGANDDIMLGRFGNNTLNDGPGNDVVDFTGNVVGVTFTTDGGDDRVIGSNYADKITGSGGDDKLEGRNGNDTLNGGLGNDTLIGAEGKNVLSDGGGNDTIDFAGNAAAVTFNTGGGDDTVFGSKFNDKLTGSSGDDCLHGGLGNDQLFGLAGNDELTGDDGNDWLEAGSAAEVAEGGAGTDYNAHKWAIDGTTSDDVNQAGIGSCVFLSGLASAADQGMNLSSRISYLGNFTYNVKLYNLETEEIDNREIVFTGFIYTTVSGKRIDPWQSHPEEFWTILFQRAYVQMSNNEDLDFTDPDDAMYAVTGRSVDTGDWGDPMVVKEALNDGKVVTAGWAADTTRVYSSHSYSVLDVYQTAQGTWRITLRNPWGVDVNASDIADGSKVATGSNDDGIMDMTWTNFQGFNDFDRISIS